MPDDETWDGERTREELARLPSVRHGLKSSISVAWLTFEAGRRQMQIFDDAWEPLVSQPEWRAYASEHLVPARPFLYLAVRDDLQRRRLLTTRKGVSAHVPFAEMARADERGDLAGFCAGLIRDIYEKWASGAGAPPPPELPRGAGDA